MTVYTAGDRWQYEPPDCPGCGARIEQEWIDVGTTTEPDGFTPGMWRCNTVGCDYGPPRGRE